MPCPANGSGHRVAEPRNHRIGFGPRRRKPLSHDPQPPPIPSQLFLTKDGLQAWLEEYRTKLSDVAGVKLESKDAHQEQAGGIQPAAPPETSAEGVADCRKACGLS